MVILLEDRPDTAYVRPESAVVAYAQPDLTTPEPVPSESPPIEPEALQNEEETPLSAPVPEVEEEQQTTHMPIAPPEPEPPAETEEEDTDRVTRVQNPYPFPPLLPETLNVSARAALVNVLCLSGIPRIRSTAGSGIIIDPRGVILTNAHVAQYMLLEKAGHPVRCTIRAGSPAVNRYTAELMHLPQAWIASHAEDITNPNPSGTGEDDFTLLAITGTVDGAPTPLSFPFIAPDTRDAIGFTDDAILVAAYPAEFISNGAQNMLGHMTASGRIGDLFTFGGGHVDVISLGATALAQGGSSGGAVVNAWGRLVGVITTTSDGDTTAERELRAITPAHIERSLAAESGLSLDAFLQQHPRETARLFSEQKAPQLAETLSNALSR